MTSVARIKSAICRSLWKGDALLEPGELFKSYDMRERRLAKDSARDPQYTVYECLSNELTFDGGYKQKTKARQSN